jgi:hypothetical protein
MYKLFIAIFSVFFLFSCAKSKHQIGEMYKGGYIFKINIWGKGLCAAPKEKFQRWGCYGTLVDGADEEKIGKGKENTDDILASCQEYGAAKYCDDYINEDYDDWYLPSIGELELMYEKLYVNDLGEFKNEVYWSSTEDFSLGAWAFDFNTAERKNSFNKSTYLLVRPIRSF